MNKLAERALQELSTLSGNENGNGKPLHTAVAEFLQHGDGQPLPATLANHLVGTLAGVNRSEQRRRSERLQTLQKQCTEIDVALVQALDSPNPELRWGAAYTLGKAGADTPVIWPAIREMLAAEDGDSRWAAAEITCAMARKNSFLHEELREATRTGQGTLRRMALYCLRDLKADGLFEVARERLEDPETHVRLSALTALTTAAVPPDQQDSVATTLIRILTADPDPGVRRSAAATIGKLQLPETRGALEKAAGSQDSGLARAATQALGRWGRKPL